MAMRRLTRMFHKPDRPNLGLELLNLDMAGQSSFVEIAEETTDADVHNEESNKTKEDNDPKLKKHTTKLMLIREHKKCAAQIEVVKGQLGAYRAVLQQMLDVYSFGKDNCPCSRYSTLNKLVSEAIKEYDHIKGTTNEERQEETSKLLGPVERLKDDTVKFYNKEHALIAQSQYYTEVNEKSLRKEVEVYKAELSRLNNENNAEKNKLEVLRKGYVQIHNYCCIRRYILLKHLVEDAVVDCLVDS